MLRKELQETSKKQNVMFQKTHNSDNQECQKRRRKSLNRVAAKNLTLHPIHAQPIRRISF